MPTREWTDFILGLGIPKEASEKAMAPIQEAIEGLPWMDKADLLMRAIEESGVDVAIPQVAAFKLPKQLWHVTRKANVDPIFREGFSFRNWKGSIGGHRLIDMKGVSLTPDKRLVKHYTKPVEELPLAQQQTAREMGEKAVLEVDAKVKNVFDPEDIELSLLEEMRAGRVGGPKDEFFGLGSLFDEYGRHDLSQELLSMMKKGKTWDLKWSGRWSPELALEKTLAEKGVDTSKLMTPESWTDAMQSLGYDAFWYAPDELLVFNPENVRPVREALLREF